MLNETTDNGTRLAQSEFVDTIGTIWPLMFARLVGGFLYLVGFVLLAYNFFRTVRAGSPATETREVAVLNKNAQDVDRMGLIATLKTEPVLYTLLGTTLLILWFFLPPYADAASLMAAIFLVVMAIAAFRRTTGGWGAWYDKLLENWMPFSVLWVYSSY